MVDKETILQVLCGLMRRPQYLSEKDKYNLTPDDFQTLFDKYVFSAIFNMYQGGAQKITPVDIDNYFSKHEVAKQVFDKENGVEYLDDALDFTQVENFPFYYRRLKKFNCIKDLKKMGFDTNNLYCEDLLNPKAKEINNRFEEMEVSQIFDIVRKKVMKLESDYSTGDASETLEATSGLEQLLEDLKVRPEVGAPVQGTIFNTICRGARRSKFYIRTASSGAGKTRQAVGDMCYLSYPVRFNTTKWQWEWSGSSERSLFIATEQKIDEIQTMILAYLTGFDEEKFLYNNFNDEERRIINQCVKVMKQYQNNVRIVTLPNPNIEQIKAVVRQNWVLYDIKNVFYDYIFSSPSLLNEFRDLHIREDVALGMLSTALKDLAVELDLFVESGTQTNAKANDDGGDKNETVVRGSRAIIDKCDLACVVTRVSESDLEILELFLKDGMPAPTHVTDVYKVRRGKYTNVKIWSRIDLGTCRKEDLFITTTDMNPINDFHEMIFEFKDHSEDDSIPRFIEDLNNGVVSEFEEVMISTDLNPHIEIADIKVEEEEDFSAFL